MSLSFNLLKNIIINAEYKYYSLFILINNSIINNYYISKLQLSNRYKLSYIKLYTF